MDFLDWAHLTQPPASLPPNEPVCYTSQLVRPTWLSEKPYFMKIFSSECIVTFQSCWFLNHILLIYTHFLCMQIYLPPNESSSCNPTGPVRKRHIRLATAGPEILRDLDNEPNYWGQFLTQSNWPAPLPPSLNNVKLNWPKRELNKNFSLTYKCNYRWKKQKFQNSFCFLKRN